MPKTDREIRDKLLGQKDDVRSSVRKKERYEKQLREIKVPYVINPMTAKPKRRIQTGTALDRILGRNGGIEEGRSVEIYGEFAAGKTQICQALAAEAEGLIIYIDSEHTYSADRFAEVCRRRGKDPEEVGKRLRLIHPDDWIEQEAVTMQLPEYDSNDMFLDVGIVIVDSIMKTWAETQDFYGRENLTQRQQLLRAQLERLVSYARRHRAVLIITNQVYVAPVDSTMKSVEEIYKSRGGATLYHFADYRILIRKSRGSLRFARLIDAIDLPLLEVPFILDSTGIADLPDVGERVRAMEYAESYGTKFDSGQSASVPAGKKHYLVALELGSATEEEIRKVMAERPKLKISDSDIEKALNRQQRTLDERMEQHSGKLLPEEAEVLGIDGEEGEVDEKT